MFSFQQFYTHFIPVTAVGHHRMNAGVIPAGKDCHGHTGICCPLQLPADLADLLVCSCPKKNFGNTQLISLLLLLCVTGIFIRILPRSTGTLSARARRLQTKTSKWWTESHCEMNVLNLLMVWKEPSGVTASVTRAAHQAATSSKMLKHHILVPGNFYKKTLQWSQFYHNPIRKN